ncbi:CCAAT-binding transcription factor (CBF-B/NF-YA) subunit B-domain-containing protein [Lipomyces arxii]|uniref:CCAAT-binding transcription factor (CBF-B/NF-YA) subunit B-domain-containing protein n=1 Tax=Lipomyces arxii TaxID=56418 RepID=UPI0034CD512B
MYAQQQQQRHFGQAPAEMSYTAGPQLLGLSILNQSAAVLQQQRQQQQMQHAQPSHLQNSAHIQHMQRPRQPEQLPLQYDDEEDGLGNELDQHDDAADLYEASPSSSMPSPINAGHMGNGVMGQTAQNMSDMTQQARADDGDQPLYVNAKQYHCILKRRLARAKLEESLKISKGRRPYLHESRHKHAMRRPRGQGGRFLTAAEVAEKEREERMREEGSASLDADKSEGSEFVNMDEGDSMLSMHINPTEMTASASTTLVAK